MIADDISTGDQVTGEGFDIGEVVDSDGTEALVELPDGNLVVHPVTSLYRPITPVEAPETNQVLHCAAGHTWARKPQRGKKPRYCPKHRPEPAKPAERRRRAEKPPQAKPEPDAKEKLHCAAGDHDWYRDRKQGKKPANCPEHQISHPSPSRVAPLDLSELRPDREAQAKLDYIQAELDRGRDRQSVAQLLETRGAIVRRLQMNARR